MRRRGDSWAWRALREMHSCRQSIHFATLLVIDSKLKTYIYSSSFQHRSCHILRHVQLGVTINKSEKRYILHFT